MLRAHGGGWMHRDDIAREIARRDLFRRPSDGCHPPSDQIRLRARKPEYQHLFECSDTACTKIRLRPGAEGLARRAALGDRTRLQKKRPAAEFGAAAPKTLTSGASSYEELREQYRPNELKILLIGESPPDPGESELRFFYAPTLSYDNLYRGVARALYDQRNDVDLGDKPSVLERIRDDGFWLIDAVEYPTNTLSSSVRDRAIADAVPALVQRCLELAPERGVIICHGKVHAFAAEALRSAGVNVLNESPLPFPLGNWRAKFIEGFREALAG